MKHIYFLILIVFSHGSYADILDQLLGIEGGTTYTDLKNRFDKKPRNNPLLKLEPYDMWAVLKYNTKGYCDRNARFNMWKCWSNIEGKTRTEDIYGVDDFRDPRVYQRLRAWLSEYKVKNPRDFLINNSKYGFKY